MTARSILDQTMAEQPWTQIAEALAAGAVVPLPTRPMLRAST